MAFTIVNGLSSITANSSWAVQPASGVQWIITHCGTSNWATINYGLYNGTLTAYINDSQKFGAVKLFVTNTNYLIMLNNVASTQTLCYCGIVV